MLNQFLMVVGVLCYLTSLALLLAAHPTSDLNVLAGGGGTLLSLGIVLAALSVRTWLRWRTYAHHKPADNERPLEDSSALALALQRVGSGEQRRSQRIPIQVGVMLRTDPPISGLETVLAFTEWVNAHGGLLQAPARLRAEQKITLFLPHTNAETACHVLQTRRISEGAFAVAFEFERQSPRFWPVGSPPLDWFATLN